MHHISSLGVALVLTTGATCFAQTLDIKWSTIDGGGGTSLGGPFRLSGTIGQPDAGPAMTGGNFSIRGGLWASSGAAINSCPGDFDGDGFVDDRDFVYFARQYDVFACSDPAMQDNCSADLNSDGFVDDTDFVLFTQAYDLFLCP